MRYEGDIYRPPGEWKSYLLQATIGCSHNTCTFCSMYKNKKYRERDIEEVLEDIKMAKAHYGSVKRVFLCDGDAIALPQEYLLKVLDTLYTKFPSLDRVSTYVGPLSTMSKTPEELKQLSDAGLYRAYLGIETGDTELLKKCGKGVTAEQMLEAGVILREAGIDLWGMVIIGLAGGGDAFMRNADLTAELVNKMNPQHLSALTFMPVEGTPLYDQIRRGEFTVQTPTQALLETRRLIEKINLKKLHFTSDHASNYLPIKGTLTQDREKMLNMIDSALANEGESLRNDRYRGL